MTNAQKMKAAIDLLESFALDYQFDLDHPLYMGFLNVSDDSLVGEDTKATWRYICAKRVLFEAILPELGLDTENGIHLGETVFVKK